MCFLPAFIHRSADEDKAAKIQESYIESFGDDIPLAESLIDSKALKANEQRKKEERLQKQVEVLQSRLEQVKPEKIPQIKSQIADGQKCIIIPINENEQATVNGLDDVI